MPGYGFSLARTAWFVPLVAAAVGYVLVVPLAQARIDELVRTSATDAAQLRGGEIELARRPALEAERVRVQALLQRSGSGGDSTRLAAAFVRGAALEAGRHHVAVTAIAATDRHIASSPGLAPAARVATSTETDPDPIALLSLDVTLDGRFADVLATIRALSRLPVLARVDVASLVRKNPDSSDATLSAALQVALAQVMLPPALRARPRPR